MTIPQTGLYTMSDDGHLSQRARRVEGETIVSALMAKTLAHPELISLAAGFVDHQTLPAEPVSQAMESFWSDPDRARSALQYGTTAGHPPLREAILDRMLRADGQTAAALNLSIDQMIISAGSNQLLFLLADTLLDPGDVVLCGAPSYFVFLGILENLGVRARGVECDEHGMIPESVDDQLARLDEAGELGRVKIIYVTTYYDNPSGTSVSAERRSALVEIAQRWSGQHKIYLVEDAAYRELRYYGEDIPSLRSFDPAGKTVIHTGTFSKSFSPGVRVGWGIFPSEVLHPVLAQKGNIDFGSPHFNQCLMTAVLEEGLLDGHVTRLREAYREKLDATLTAADEFLSGIDGVSWIHPTGGLYVWVRLPESIDTGLSGPLFDRAMEEGLLYVPGECCYPTDGTPGKKSRLRLSFGIQSCESIRRGVNALGRAIRQVLS